MEGQTKSVSQQCSYMNCNVAPTPWWSDLQRNVPSCCHFLVFSWFCPLQGFPSVPLWIFPCSIHSATFPGAMFLWRSNVPSQSQAHIRMCRTSKKIIRQNSCWIFLVRLECCRATRDLESCFHKSAFVTKAHGFGILFFLILYFAARCAMQSLAPRKSISAISLDFLCSEDGFFFLKLRIKHKEGVPCFIWELWWIKSRHVFSIVI